MERQIRKPPPVRLAAVEAALAPQVPRAVVSAVKQRLKEAAQVAQVEERVPSGRPARAVVMPLASAVAPAGQAEALLAPKVKQAEPVKLARQQALAAIRVAHSMPTATIRLRTKARVRAAAAHSQEISTAALDVFRGPPSLRSGSCCFVDPAARVIE